jgi:hypothetical protein
MKTMSEAMKSCFTQNRHHGPPPPPEVLSSRGIGTSVPDSQSVEHRGGQEVMARTCSREVQI